MMTGILVEKTVLTSLILQRDVKVDFYLPNEVEPTVNLNLLLVNDGQDLVTMDFASILDNLYQAGSIQPVLCVGIHAGAERRREYGVAGQPDYKDRGDLAGNYTRFIFEELLPYIYLTTGIRQFKERAFTGFSLGALSALDITWNHSEVFQQAAIFSGSLWWRSVAQEDKEYDDDKHRIMHQVIRNSSYKPGLRFYFQCGNRDEVRDRNKNGVIDSIDDTLDLIKELEAKGYKAGKDIRYTNLEDGQHDVPTWARAFPDFLKWAFPLAR